MIEFDDIGNLPSRSVIVVSLDPKELLTFRLYVIKWRVETSFTRSQAMMVPSLFDCNEIYAQLLEKKQYQYYTGRTTICRYQGGDCM